MRHSNSGRKFSRSPSHRKAMFMNLAKALIMHGRICTTEMRAKDLRGVVEPLITLAKRNDLHSRRLAYRELNDHAIVKHLFDKVGPIFAETPGGYTRIIKLAKNRRGDNAPMAIIEFSHTKGPGQEKAATPKTEAKQPTAEKSGNAAEQENVEPQTSIDSTQATESEKAVQQ